MSKKHFRIEPVFYRRPKALGSDASQRIPAMNIVRQQEILDQLAAILHANAPPRYDSVSCRYNYEYETISSQLSYVLRGKTHNARLSTGAATDNLILCEELRALMAAHTGGVWGALTLILDRDGKAQAQFEYPK